MRSDAYLRKIEREIKEDTYLSCGAQVKRSEEADREKKKSISGFLLSFFLTLTLFSQQKYLFRNEQIGEKIGK